MTKENLISENIDISNMNTLRVVANADRYAKPTSIEELAEICKIAKSENSKLNILGAGSNLLLSSRAIPGITVNMTGISFIKKINDTQFELGAGVRMPRFCAEAAKESLAGAEFMEGIPGTIGGGVVMNAGAHGSEIAKILKSLKLLNLETLEIEEYQIPDSEELGSKPLTKLNDNCISNEIAFSYRRSTIDLSKQIVISVIFELEADDKNKIREKIIENNLARTTHQPIKAWTCGCTFKNPEGYRAGLLIDQLGAKGMKEGDFHVSNKHGNFFENDDKGTSMDFCKLMSRVQDLAFDKEGVILSPEVKPMGEFSAEEQLVWNPQKRLL